MKIVMNVKGNLYFKKKSVLNGHTQDVKMVKWDPIKPILYSASYDNTIKVWIEEVDDWYCISTLTGHSSTVWSIDLNLKGDLLLSGSEDKTGKIKK
jgi:cytosolic iron-sulfur protein assembly protein CIAO1